MRECSEHILISAIREGPKPAQAILEPCNGFYHDPERTRLLPISPNSARKLLETASNARTAIAMLKYAAADVGPVGSGKVNSIALIELAKAAEKVEIDARWLPRWGTMDSSGRLHWPK